MTPPRHRQIPVSSHRVRLLGVCICVVVSVAACNHHTRDIDAQVREAYRQYTDAVRRMDSRSYMSFFTDDFAMRSPDGRIHDRAEMEKYQRINAQTTKKVNSYSADIQAITPVSDSVVAVIVLQKYDRDQAPLEEPNKPHRIETSAVQREIWHLSQNGAKIGRIEEILVGPVLIDGKSQ